MSLILGVQTGLVYIILCNVVHYRRLTDEDGIPSTASVPECQEICKQTEQGCGGSRDQHPIASLRQGLVAPEWAEMGLQINRNGKVYGNICIGMARYMTIYGIWNGRSIRQAPPHFYPWKVFSYGIIPTLPFLVWEYSQWAKESKPLHICLQKLFFAWFMFR